MADKHENMPGMDKSAKKPAPPQETEKNAQEGKPKQPEPAVKPKHEH